MPAQYGVKRLYYVVWGASGEFLGEYDSLAIAYERARLNKGVLKRIQITDDDKKVEQLFRCFKGG